jgi:hypothetical protein
MLVGDQRLTFVEGTVRRSVGGAMLEVSAARESNGGIAAHAQLLGKFGPIYVNVEALIANDFHLRGEDAESSREGRISLDAPVRIGKILIPLHGEAHLIDRTDGSRAVDAATRLSVSLDRFNLGASLGYRRDYTAQGPSPPGEVYSEMLASGRVGDVRVRGLADFDISPSARFQSAELSAYWSSSESSDWEAGVAYDGPEKRARARLTHILRVESFALAVTGEAASDGSVALGFNLNFSLDPRHGFTHSRQQLAEGGMIHATVFRDLNDNGVHDPGEPLEKGALVTTGSTSTQRKTDASGDVTVGGLTPYVAIPVGIDLTSLEDPSLVPQKAVQVVVPRPGVPAEVQIGLVGGGDIEGALMKSGELGFEGIDLELVDSSGKVAQVARTDFDGFFLFDRVAYGKYSIRIGAASAVAAKLAPDLGLAVENTPDRSVVRLGSIQPKSVQRIAAADFAPATP